MNRFEQALNWQDLTPTLCIDKLPHDNVTFFDLQPRVSSALSQFLQNSDRTLLVLKADDQAKYMPLLERFIGAHSFSDDDEKIHGVNYVIEQADSFSFARVHAEPAQSTQDNFAAKKSVGSALYFDQNRLLGSIRVHPMSKDIQLNAGLVHELNGGVLILNLAALLDKFELWQRLKQILQTQMFDWYSAHPFKPLPCEIPSYPLSLKVILLGQREDLAVFSELEPDLFRFADYAEIESYFAMEDETAHCQWAKYVRDFAVSQHLPVPDMAGLIKLYQLLVRESEDRQLINISPTMLKNWLTKAGLSHKNTGDKGISAGDFERVFQQTQYQQGFLREQAYADILHEQVYIPTEGEEVGQINGLSVVDYAGAPLSFGEPSRISCLVKFGDGEIIDVERKSELAGNLHGKGMLIAESCLAGILQLPSQLPFSASLVFEQSYGEINGDSASLAAFCVLTSALSDVAIPQSIAITGTIDQFGLVHAVGGVNDKIEGFFTICERRGLTGKQGVIIPAATINQLSLSESVQSAVRNQQFFIWAVEDVYQTGKILFARDLVEEPDKIYTEDNQPLARLIHQRIELHADSPRFSLWRALLGKK
ncbi:Lon protease family protein [Bisgaard Taxon 10/6]|uniref:endopeptidase La n=1 Tax=Exercitatus varius TaxID=67857 RepID=A0ABT6EQU1_9PAST|nr:Lon protease family protein [Exercitatus varius]MDG2938873.1 Lon protease family protein [Exercitatus varius]MDG2945928.1 Lon protease family protein [Exercitatus varius]